MGLLSDPDRRSGLMDAVISHANKLSLLLYISSFLAFLALFHPLLREKTYFSENALLANQVELTFNNEHLAMKLERELRELASAKRQMPHDWIVEKLESFEIEAYLQNFTVYHPFMANPKTGQNVYGILRAPRHSSTESIVFAIPYEVGTVYKSIPLALSLAQHFRNQIYWAKDLIFVFSDSKLNGLQSWLQAYHGHPESGAVEASRLETRGGSIQAAFSIEVSQSSCDGLNFVLEGMNGQMPNLDLFNVVDKLTRSSGGTVYLHGRADPPTRDLLENCWGLIQTTLLGMWQQASGRPVSGHSLFLPYHIDALSIKCQPATEGESGKRSRYSSMGYLQMGRAIEGTVRSVNNLLERFHQSFFYYVLPSTNVYISIGMYIPTLAVCLLSSAVKALSLWYKALVVFHEFEQPEIPSLKVIPDVTSFFRILSTAFLLPTMVYFSVPYFNEVKLQYLFNDLFDYGDILVVVFSTAFLTIASFPFCLQSLYCPVKLDVNQRKVFKSIAMFMSIVGIGCNCVANFSLTYFVAVFAVPLMNVSGPTYCKYLRRFQKCLFILLSPLTAAILLPMCSFVYSFPEEELSFDVWYSQVKSLTLKIVHENYVHNSNLLWQMWVLFIPLWLLHWFLLWLPVEEAGLTEKSASDKPKKENREPEFSDVKSYGECSH